MAAYESTAARPYAKAVFELAREESDLGGWSERLAVLAMIARDPTLLSLLGSPRVKSAEIAQLVIDVAGDRLNEDVRNFVRLLAHNRRLAALPAIAQRFEQLRAEAERVVSAELISAREIEEVEVASVREALEKRLGRRVQMETRTDPALLGGVIVRTGDLVIDGSARARLHKLTAALMH